MELATLLMERCLPEALQPLAGAHVGRGCRAVPGKTPTSRLPLPPSPSTAQHRAPRLHPASHPAPELHGDMCDARALGEQLLRMGEALGFTTVPLTPGGSVAVEAADAAAEQQDGEAAEEAEDEAAL